MAVYTIVTDFDHPQITMNESRRAHFHKQAKVKKEIGAHVQEKAKFIPPLFGPVTVEVVWWVPDKRRRDSDSLGFFLKAVCDGLVNANVLEDDHSLFVPTTMCSIKHGEYDRPRIEIVITEILDEVLVEVRP